jgi:hypothetical protein
MSILYGIRRLPASSRIRGNNLISQSV